VGNGDKNRDGLCLTVKGKNFSREDVIFHSYRKAKIYNGILKQKGGRRRNKKNM